MFFGGGNTTYENILSGLALAASDDSVDQVTLNIDSPGGQVDGMFDVMAALESFPKPVTARAKNANSAAFGIAAMAQTIEATGPASTFGSIGVAASIYVSDRVVDITSTEAPDKRPDASTEEGKAVIRRHLDAIHDLFVDGIARGRGVSTAKVNKDFGRGAVLLAGEAQRLGMINSIAGEAQPRRPAGTRAANDGNPKTNEKVVMSLEELKAQHPNLCSQLVAEGRAEGTTAERQRVNAHLTMGQSSGDLDTAYAAIEGGLGMTVDLQAKYMSAGMNRASVAARQTEPEAAAAVVAGAEAPPEPTADSEHEDKVAAEVERLMGVSANG